MVRRIGPLMFGQKTGRYFAALLTVILTSFYLLPIQIIIIGNSLIALVIIAVLAWLTSILVFSFKTNSTAYHKVVKWCVSAIVVAVLSLSLLRHFGERLRVELVQYGVTTEAIVIDKQVSSTKSTPPTFMLTVQYENERNEINVQRFNIGIEAFESIEINQPILVRYSKRHPSLMRLISE